MDTNETPHAAEPEKAGATSAKAILAKHLAPDIPPLEAVLTTIVLPRLTEFCEKFTAAELPCEIKTVRQSLAGLVNGTASQTPDGTSDAESFLSEVTLVFEAGHWLSAKMNLFGGVIEIHRGLSARYAKHGRDPVVTREVSFKPAGFTTDALDKAVAPFFQLAAKLAVEERVRMNRR